MRSADTFTLVVPRARISFGDRAFSFPGPRAWDSLPMHVPSAQSMYRCTHLENSELVIPTYVFLTFIRVLTSLSGVFVAFFCVRRHKFVFSTLHYITL